MRKGYKSYNFFENVIFTKVLAFEKSYNFYVWKKPNLDFNMFLFPFELTWPCINPGHGQAQVFIKTEAVGASFCKTVHVTS